MPTTRASDDDAAAAVARFRADLLALGVAPTAGGPIALAVSGGADSMAMLWLANAAFPGAVIAATVDHGLRAEAAAEAAMVGDWCQSVGVPHATLTVAAPITGSSIQAGARGARYALLRDWALAADAVAIATAHHADDQAETFLMRAARGSGIAGLAGIRARREMLAASDRPIAIVRPLLGWRRDALRALAEAQGVPFVDDPSNTDEAFDRVRFRRILADTPDLKVEALAASATYAAEMEATLAAIADAEWLRRRRWDAPPVLVEIGGLPRDIRRRIARAAITAVRNDGAIARPDWHDAVNIEPLLDALDAGRAATQAGVVVRPDGTLWHFAPAPPRRSS